ncbi:MAG: HAD family hydrolase [Akkermansiaceae bacterium]|nr:HAD family hydrolase [Akkermansiaceae bacterium]
MIPSLIFDLDGTLIDSLPGIADSLNRALEKQGLPTQPQAAVRSYVGNGLKLLVERAAPDADEATIEALIESFKEDYQHSWIEGTRAYTGITQLLKELQRSGHQLAVLSNKVQPFTQTITREIFPTVHFTSVTGQQDGIPHKPHPLGALNIAAAMGRNPRDCILIGDSVADVETADNAEMQFIGCTWGYQDRIRLIEAGAKHFIDKPSQLPHLLSTLEGDTGAY